MSAQSKRLVGQKIRRLRERRGMTQRELANASDLGESALRSYELGVRYPKDACLDRIARALHVSPEAFEVYGIDNDAQLVHVLFNFEDAFGIHSLGCGTAVVVVDDNMPLLREAIRDWGKKHDELERGEISTEEYQDWKDTYTLPAQRAVGG